MSEAQDRQREAIEASAAEQLCLLCLYGEEEGILFAYTDPTDGETVWFHAWCLHEAQEKVEQRKQRRAG